jgi:hypothetical protein
MSKLIGIPSQEDFPRRDISEDTAQILGLLLANQQARLSGHESVDSIELYFNAHRLILTAGQRIPNLSHRGAFNHGIVTYELVAAMVRPMVTYEDLTVPKIGLVPVGLEGTNDFLRVLEEAGEKFGDMPNTASVVNETVEYVYPGLGMYAVYGAAMARQVELAATG